MRTNTKGDLGYFAIQERHDQKLFNLYLFSFLLNFHYDFVIAVSLIKLVFFQLACEESTFWFSLFSSRAMNKSISTRDRLFLAVSDRS